MDDRIRKYVNRKGFIVIHEEDDLIRELLERWLGEAGYTVIATGQEVARAGAQGEAPRLVIANVASPRGAQPLIHSLQAVYAAPILVLSGRFRRGLGTSDEAARRLGVRKVLPKPFTRDELLSAVREALEGAA
jgi:DNA-binding response OmpR family regulator